MADDILELLEKDGNTIIEGDLDKDQSGGGNDLDSDKDNEVSKGGDDDSTTSTTFNFKDSFDGYENVDQVKSMAERGKSWTPEMETEYQSLKENSDKFEKLEEKAKQVGEINPYKNSKFYQLDKLMETDPNNTEFYQSYMFGKMSEKDLVKFDLLSKYPDVFKEDPEALERKLSRKYPGVFGDEGYGPDDPEYKDSMADIKIDAAEIKSNWDTKISKIEVPDLKGSEEKQKSANEAFAKSWNPLVKDLKEETKKFSLDVIGEDGNEVHFMDIDIPEKDLQYVWDLAANQVIGGKMEPNKESIAMAKKVAIGVYAAENLPYLLTQFADKLSEQMNGKWRKTITNAQKFDSDGKPIPKGVQNLGDAKDKMGSQVLADM